LRTRRASVLALVVVTVLVTALLGLSLADRMIRASRSASWTRHHAVLRALVESAVEELHVRLQTAANTSGEETFNLLRTAPVAPSAPATPLPGLETPQLAGELESLESSLGGTLEITHAVRMRRLAAIGADPLERTGLVTIEATARLKRAGSPSITERIRVDRSFRVARTTPPRPLDEVGLFVASPAKDLKAARGRPVMARAAGGPHRLVDLLTRRGAEGVSVVRGAQAQQFRQALGQMNPALLRSRAHLIVESASHLVAVISRHTAAGGSLSGVIHVDSADPLVLECPRFRGKCLLSLGGMVHVRDVRVEDPRRDSLTIVTPGRIVVVGREIDANLIHTGNLPEGITFQRVARVRGVVASGRFPRSATLKPADFGQCMFESSPALSPGTASAAGPDGSTLSGYVVVWSPRPVATEHGRDGDAWSEW
jgi:hypothetical protein